MDVSVIIVNYNTLDLTRNCLKSIYEQTKDINFEVIVSDNGSVDGSIEMIRQNFPQVVLIENNANLGFGAANNRGLKIARGKYIFYLNSDTILLNNAIKIFYDYWETNENKSELGALGANLLNKDGEIAISYASFPNAKKELINFLKRMIGTPIKWLFPKLIRKKHTTYTYYTGDVDYICGADLFLLNDENAYFDEIFFLYYEETDLQFKMMQKNLKRKIIEGPKIIHLEGGSDIKELNINYYVSFGNQYKDYSRVIYIRKNLSILISNILRVLLGLYWSQPIYYSKTKEMRQKLEKIS